MARKRTRADNAPAAKRNKTNTEDDYPPPKTRNSSSGKTKPAASGRRTSARLKATTPAVAEQLPSLTISEETEPETGVTAPNFFLAHFPVISDAMGVDIDISLEPSITSGDASASMDESRDSQAETTTDEPSVEDEIYWGETEQYKQSQAHATFDLESEDNSIATIEDVEPQIKQEEVDTAREEAVEVHTTQAKKGDNSTAPAIEMTASTAKVEHVEAATAVIEEPIKPDPAAVDFTSTILTNLFSMNPALSERLDLWNINDYTELGFVYDGWHYKVGFEVTGMVETTAAAAAAPTQTETQPAAPAIFLSPITKPDLSLDTKKIGNPLSNAPALTPTTHSPKKLCMFGKNCTKGYSCSYSHANDAETSACKFGTSCTKGDKCAFSHAKSAAAAAVAAAPKPLCTWVNTRAGCAKGDNCLRSHEKKGVQCRASTLRDGCKSGLHCAYKHQDD